METTNLKGEKLSKNSIQIHLLGTLDELNAHLGLIKVKVINEKNKNFLEAVQVKIMKMMSHVSFSTNEGYLFLKEDADELEKEIENLKTGFNGESKFVVPGKNETEAFIHIARTVARRAERYFAAVNEQAPLCLHAGAYLNKLSEYLFYLGENCINITAE